MRASPLYDVWILAAGGTDDEWFDPNKEGIAPFPE